MSKTTSPPTPHTSEPTSISGLLNLTVACNHDCIFCCDGDVKGSKHHLSFQEACARLERLKDTGADSVTIIGGEPLLHKDIVRVVQHATSLGMRPGITSNGTLLTPELLAQLVDAGLTSLEISMHAASDELSREISQRQFTPQKQREALQALKDFKGNRPGVAINFVMFARNFHELPQFVDMVADNYSFIEELFINFVDPIGYPGQFPELVPTHTRVQPVLREALTLATEAGLSFTVDSVPGCVLGSWFLYLRATKEKLQGKLYAKDTLRIQNAAPDPDQSQYYRINACFDCPISGLCPGVNFRYLKIHGAKGLRPYSSDELTADLVAIPPEVEAAAKQALKNRPQKRPDAPVGLELQDWKGRGYTRHQPGWPYFISNQCNAGCAVCPFEVESHPAHKNHPADNHRPLFLSGREPPLNKGFFKLLRRAGEGAPVHFSTNARVFSYGSWVRKLRDKNIGSVVVRIPAPLFALDSVTRSSDAETQTRQGIENLLSLRQFPVRAEILVAPDTQSAITPTLEYFSQLGLYRIRVLTYKSHDLDPSELEKLASDLRLSLQLLRNVPGC